MRRRYVMGTFLSVHINGENSEGLESIFFNEVQRLEELLSRFRPESEISRINRAAGRDTVHVSEETCEVIEKALCFAVRSGGAFDPTATLFTTPSPSMGDHRSDASLDRWPSLVREQRLLGGWDGGVRRRPEPPSLPHKGGGSSDYRQVYLDPIARTVFLAALGVRLDLGGIGKGFALDKALACVQEAGKPAFVSADFGGQLLFWHAGGLPAPETIVIENPNSRSAAMTFQMSANGSVSTSSNAERSNHLIDPQSGQPARGTASVTVVAPTATEAEALSTALFVLGAEQGQVLLQTQPGVQIFFT